MVVGLYELFKFKSMIDHVKIGRHEGLALRVGNKTIHVSLVEYRELQRVYESLVWFEQTTTILGIVARICGMCDLPIERFENGWIIGEKIFPDSACN